VRRLALVASAVGPAGRERELDEAHRWLGALPSQSIRHYRRLADASLEQSDVLWIRGAVDDDPRLLAWLRAGGRILATHDGVRLSVALGLERDPPEAAPFLHPPPPGFGLAGFGPHPLFVGLRDGAVLTPTFDDGPPTLCCYVGRPPADGAVVAVGRRGLELDPDTVLAWEYAVGAGGMLCLGFHPSLLTHGDEVQRRDAEVVLANALVGDAIPHRERATPAALWPPRGRQATGGEAGEPLLVAPADDWPASVAPALDLAPAAEWTHAGRRLLVRARASGGRREVWAPPFRIMHEAGIRDAITCAPAHVAADEMAGGLATGDHRMLERWIAAADVPAVVWEVGGQAGLEITAEWEVDLRRGWPYPAGSYGDLAFAVAADGRSFGVTSAAGPRARFAVTGGSFVLDGATDAPIVRVRCAGVTPLRIVAAAGIDAEELQRAIRVLERAGVRGLAEARARKAAQLERYGTAFEAPDEMLARGFAWSRQRGDEALVGVPGVGRAVLAACPRGASEDAWCFGTQACAAAGAQLVAGNRDPARELLKFLAQTQHPDGGIPAYHPLGGLASVPEPASTLAFLDLAERVLAWTGEVEPLRRLRGSLAGALDFLARHPADGLPVHARMLDALEPLVDGAAAGRSIEILQARSAVAGGPTTVEAHAVVEAAAAALRRAPGSLPGTGAAPALLEAVASLWGLEPDAPDAALALAPILPAGWTGYALRRLRIGRSLLDLELRRRPGAIVVRTVHLFGPRLVLTIDLRGVGVETTEVDDVALAGGRARFEAYARHEVRFLLRA
jgi:hypothetical protein